MQSNLSLMSHIGFIRRALPLGGLLLASCSLGPDYRPAGANDLGVPSSYARGGTSTTPEDMRQWWRRFGDPQLDALVADAFAGNLDLVVAISRLRQSRESVVQARSNGLPSATASAGARENIASNGERSTNFSVDGDASWEIDLFGGVRRSVEAARADQGASAYDLAAVRVALAADIATNYLQLRLAQQQVAVARDTLKVSDENLDISRWRLRAGLVSSLDVEQARGTRAQTAASLPNYERDAATAIHRLSVLTGRAPGSLVNQLSIAAAIPSPPSSIATGIPADVLRQRPDVRSAERSVAGATARIGVAEAELYPALRLTGNISTAALSIGGLIDTLAGSLFAGLSQTLFDGGRARSQVRSQQAAAEGAVATYRQTVLTALEDVENALVAINTAERRRQEFLTAVEATNNQAILARSLYRSGLNDFATLLEAERSLLSARDGLVSSEAAKSLAVVQLYRALGGGWDAAQPASEKTS